MNAQGILFLNKNHPTVGTTPDGQFELVITALDRISQRSCELWRVVYRGQRAKDLWDSCSAILVPGQPIQINTKNIRVYNNGNPIIEAMADAIAIAPRSHLVEGGGA